MRIVRFYQKEVNITIWFQQTKEPRGVFNHFVESAETRILLYRSITWAVLGSNQRPAD